MISRDDYAYLLLRLARYEEADQVLQEALQIAEENLVPEATPPTPNWANAVVFRGCCHHMVGLLQLDTARFAEAEQHLRQAIDLLSPLVRRFSRGRFGRRTTWESGTTIWPRC